MTGVVGAILVALAAWNPAAVAERARLSDAGASSAARDRAVGMAAGLVIVLGIAAATGPIIDALDISEPTLRTAAGAVVALVGARWLVGPAPRPDDVPGVSAGMLDVLTPSIVLAAMTTTASEGWPVTLLAAALAAAAGVGLTSTPLRPRVAEWLRRLIGGGAVAVGIALVYAGIRGV